MGTALLTTVATDNGANFVKMHIALLQNVGKDDVDNIGIEPDNWEDSANNLDDFECLGCRCVAHTMQLAVLDVVKGDNALSGISNANNVVREIPVITKRSATLRAKLCDVQKRAGRPVKVIDCSRRFDQLYVDYQNMGLLGLFDEVEIEIPCESESKS